MGTFSKLITFLAALMMSATAWAGGPVQDASDAEQGAEEAALTESIDPIADGISGGRRVYRRRTYRTRRPSRRVHTHRSRSRVVVVGGHHHGHRTARRAASPAPRRDSGFSMGLRFTSLSLGDTQLRYETFEGASLAGVGGYIRGRFDTNWGIELAVDMMGAAADDYDQISIPVMAGLMAHLFPESTLDIYGIAGGGMTFSKVDYYPVVLGGTTQAYGETYTQFAGQLGGGLEVNLGALQLTTDLRWLFMQARPERQDDVRTATGTGDGPSTSADDLSMGLQAMVGIGGNF